MHAAKLSWHTGTTNRTEPSLMLLVPLVLVLLSQVRMFTVGHISIEKCLYIKEFPHTVSDYAWAHAEDEQSYAGSTLALHNFF